MVQYAAELPRQGQESAVVAGELDDGRPELAGERLRSAVGKLPLRSAAVSANSGPGAPSGDAVHDARHRQVRHARPLGRVGHPPRQPDQKARICAIYVLIGEEPFFAPISVATCASGAPAPVTERDAISSHR
jgi:hypothetical protein